MGVDNPKFKFSLQTKCSRHIPGGSPGMTFIGDKLPDDKTFQGMIDNANNALANCGKCIGPGCETWKLAHASIAQARELVLGLTAELPSGDTS